MGRRIGYIRVSTQEQHTDRQTDGLRLLCDEMHIEKCSARSKKRPVFESVMCQLRKGDALIVWDLDRAFRSAIDAIVQAELLRARGVEFRIATMNVDTSTETGWCLYAMMSVFAEMEVRIRARRTREGMAAQKAKGIRMGRPLKLTSKQVQSARKRIKQEALTDIANDLEVSRWTLKRALERQTALLGESSIETPVA